jgi:hypothetical protein
VARNAVRLALLAALALSGCSNLDNLPFLGNKKAKEAEVRAAALRVRTDSLRKVRRAADSLAQVRFAVCVDSVRAELIKPPVVVKKAQTKRKSRKAPPARPSEELIAVQAQSACASDAAPPMPVLAADSGSPKKALSADSASSKTTVAAAKAAPPKPPAADSSKAPVPAADTARAAGTAPATDQGVVADSLQKAKETEMFRETFAYSGSTRDPFNSLLNMAKSGPEVADLQLVGIYQNMRSSSGHVAVFREKEGGRRHKLRAGDQLGRSRVIQIRERDVVFMIEDFGFERQETLSLRKQEDVTP